MRNFLVILFSLFIPLLTTPVFANENICSNRFLTLVNPVRGRQLWVDKSITPLKDQYELIRIHDFAATWLLQYDTLNDGELLEEIKTFTKNQELGILLEVSQKFADESRIIYPNFTPWFSPKAVFLSGYSQSQRRKLIDKLFWQFKQKLGYYPKSVGAWWIDSYSLNYMKEKYQIKAALIVADQKTTDNYGVWGQWWGVPFYPAKANILTSASSLSNKQDVVIIQWAQRDPLLAYEEGPESSNFSLQANDYIRQGKDTQYFEQLVNIYLDCKNPIGQITVGLETGIESVAFFNEYKNQLANLKKRENVAGITMSEFADRFSSTYPDFPRNLTIAYQDSNWDLRMDGRTNKRLGDSISYNQEISFADYFTKDNADFLDRRLKNINIQKDLIFFPWYLIVSLGLFLFSFQKLKKVWFISMLFAVASYGLILRSFYQYGWRIYFGPNLIYLEFFQIALVTISFLIVWQVNRINKSIFNIWLLPLIFGIDPIIGSIRGSYISSRYYFGFAIDALRFVGFSFAAPFDFKFVNTDFPSTLAAGLLRFNFVKIWDDLLLSLIVYPFIHIVLAFILGLLLVKIPGRLRNVAIAALIILFVLHIVNIFQTDPRSVTPILLQ